MGDKLDKYEQLKQKIDEVKTKSLVKEEMKAFAQLLISATNKSKEELAKLSDKNIQIIRDSIAYIEAFHEKQIKTIDEKTDIARSEFDTKLATLKDIITEVKNSKPKDGKDADETVIIEKVLSQIKLPEIKEVILDDGEKIADKLEALEGEAKLDFSALKNVPQFKGGKSGGVVARNIYQMGDVSLTSLANGNTLVWDDTNKLWVNGAGSSVGAFTDLTDVPSSYTSQALKVVRVNAGETGLEFTTLAGGGDALTADPLSQFAATTSLQLAGVISDETGSGALVFANTPTLVTPEIGEATGTGLTLSGLTASEIVITNGSKKLVSAAVATYPSLTELTYVKGLTSSAQTQITARALGATTITIAGTANQITSSAGAQDLSANRTWTLSLPADVIIPTVLTIPNTGLHLLDTNASHDLIIKPGSDISADRTLIITTGDTDMIVNLTATTDEYVLAYDVGTNTWRGVAGGSGSPGGSDTQVQFNDASSFGGDAGFTYNKTTNIATLGGLVTADIHTVDATAPDSIVILSGSATSGDNFGGSFNVTAGNSSGTSAGGGFNMVAGDGGATGAGGSFSIDGGTGGATSGNGGSITITAGSADASGDGGNVTLAPGSGGGAGVAGIISLDGVTQISSLTASEIVITDASKNLVSAAVATYPSLTELTYVKGLTSSAQTQISALPTATSTTTFTNKRIQPRTASSTTNANLSPDLSTANVYFRTTQTATLTIDAPTGTPVIGETIMIYVDSAGAQTLTIDSAYKVFGAAFPAATTAGKTFMMSAQYNGTDWKTLWANKV